VTELERDLAEAIERQSATDHVLEAIGRSASKLEPVFDTVLRQALRLCRADGGQIYVLDGDAYRVALALGGSDEYRAYLETVPLEPGPGTMVGRVGLERRTHQIRDVLADRDYSLPRAQELGNWRTMLGVPMLAGGEVVGVITLWRDTVAPFDERTTALVTTFAAQGAIAIQNAQLFQALQRRERQLARSVDELGALGEISHAVSSSLDPDEVLATIVTHAVQLTGAEGGSIFEFHAAEQRFRIRAWSGTSDELLAMLQARPIGLDDTFVGRAASAGVARQAPDLEAERLDPHIDALRRTGWRSMLTVPLRREQEILGALIVRRKVPGGFPDRTVELVETLANQSSVAIHNARLFHDLEEKSRQLEVAGRHKSEFLASMSHELRTPLNAVIGFSDVLLEQMFGELNDKQAEYIRDIRDSGRHLLELINEILDLSKVEAGRMELEPAALSLPDLLEHALALVRERATRGQVAVSLAIAPEVGVVWADELKLKQVVINLLTNAVKFTERGGVVEVRALLEGEEAQVLVRDTGIGIAASEHERIFEAFQRGGRGPRPSTEGTGLGLTLSKRIVELHGGRIWMTSEVGVGSTFGFAIPIGAAPPAAEAPAAEGSSAVLVVEDDRRSADLLSLYLQGAGYDVVVARDGAEGLRLARRIRPSAVLLDVLLPRLDGWEVLTALKSDPATSGCPVLVVSMLDERGKGFALGAVEYLVKPVAREELLDALARWLPLRAEEQA
jgi:signal transduction histidine kinase/ActR/RegA family two-component response regulator